MERLIWDKLPDQHILGSWRPVSLGRMRRPPMGVLNRTLPGISSVTVPIRAAFSPPGVRRMDSSMASASWGAQTASIRPSQAQ